MNYKRGLGIGLIFVGLFIVLTSRVITGAVIGFQPENYLGLFGVLVFLVGVFLVFVSRTYQDNKSMVKRVLKEYERGKFNPVEAVLRISGDLLPDGIRIIGVDYRGGDRGTIKTEGGGIPMRFRDQDKARDLALALYEIAVFNDRKNAKNCELHIARGVSSKHYRGGLDALIKDFEEKNKESLKEIRRT